MLTYLIECNILAEGKNFQTSHNFGWKNDILYFHIAGERGDVQGGVGDAGESDKFRTAVKF